METIINQHCLDIEYLMSSCIPLTGLTQAGDYGTSQCEDKDILNKLICMRIALPNDSKASLAENETVKNDPSVSSRPLVGLRGGDDNTCQGPVREEALYGEVQSAHGEAVAGAAGGDGGADSVHRKPSNYVI
ncbi:hypothetical protein LguiA_034576 [Lonicera macranthoides]